MKIVLLDKDGKELVSGECVFNLGKILDLERHLIHSKESAFTSFEQVVFFVMGEQTEIGKKMQEKKELLGEESSSKFPFCLMHGLLEVAIGSKIPDGVSYMSIKSQFLAMMLDFIQTQVLPKKKES